MQQWLRRPALTIVLSPGERDGLRRNEGAVRAARSGSRRRPAGQADPHAAGGRPALGAGLPDDHPHDARERHPLEYAQRNAVPTTQLALVFNAGEASDAVDSRGLSAFAMNVMDEGTPR